MAAKNKKARRTPIMARCPRCEKTAPHKERADRPGKPHAACLDCAKKAARALRDERWAEEKVRNTLKGMINRCHNPQAMKRWANAAGIAGSWRDYGAVGVRVCDGLREGSAGRRSAGLALFLSVVGLPPSKTHTLDRIDPFGSYTCGRCDACRDEGALENVRWADKATQDANRKNVRLIPGYDPDTGDFVELGINEWSRRLEIVPFAFRRRLKAYGAGDPRWPIERVFARGRQPAADDDLPELTEEEEREVRELEGEPEPEPIEDPETPF